MQQTSMMMSAKAIVASTTSNATSSGPTTEIDPPTSEALTSNRHSSAGVATEGPKSTAGGKKRPSPRCNGTLPGDQNPRILLETGNRRQDDSMMDCSDEAERRSP